MKDDPIKEAILNPSPAPAVIWRCTGEVRFAKRFIPSEWDRKGIAITAKLIEVLQQRWIDAEGNVQWRDVPAVADGAP